MAILHCFLEVCKVFKKIKKYLQLFEMLYHLIDRNTKRGKVIRRQNHDIQKAKTSGEMPA